MGLSQFLNTIMFDHDPNIKTIQTSDSVGDVDKHVMPFTDPDAIASTKKIAVVGASAFHGNWADPQCVTPMMLNDAHRMQIFQESSWREGLTKLVLFRFCPPTSDYIWVLSR